MKPILPARSLFGLLALAILITAFLLPCCAASADILIQKSGGLMSWTDAHIDNNLVAAYVDTAIPSEIRIYTADGKMYATIPLTNSTSRLESLEISGSRVYYTEYDNAITWTDRKETVYEYNLDTQKKRVLYTTGSIADQLAKNGEEIVKNGGQVNGERITKIVANGDHVVLRGGIDDRKLILLTLPTGSSQVIFSSRDWIHGLAIDGDRIMWGCERVDKKPGREIHVYTISTGNDYIIPESISEKTYGYGDLSGDNVVWATGAKEPEYINGVPVLGNSGYNMQLTNLDSGRTQSIEQSDTAPITVPFISGDTIAWVKKPRVDYNNSDIGTIRTYNITTGTFGDFASDVDYISDFDTGVILWGRLHPVSFWVTPLSGKIPEVTSSPLSQTASQSPAAIQKTTSSQKSPVDPGLAVAVLAVGATGYIILKKRR